MEVFWGHGVGWEDVGEGSLNSCMFSVQSCLMEAAWSTTTEISASSLSLHWQTS